MNKENVRTSIIWKISHDDLQKLLDESNSHKQILTKLGFSSFSGNRKTLDKRLHQEFFNKDKFNENHKNLTHRVLSDLSHNRSLTAKDYLVENCKHARKNVRDYILKNDLVPYYCEKCKNIGEWLGKN